MREPFSFTHVDYDISVDGSLPGAYGNTDFDNRGVNADKRLASTVNGFLYAHAGAQLQVGEFGASVTGELFQYDVNPTSGGQGLTLVYGRFHALAGYGIAENQVVVGAGARIATVALKEQSSSFQQIAGGGHTLFSLSGASPEIGAVIKPQNFPLRLGATLRFPVEATAASTNGTTTGDAEKAGAFIVPSRVVLPWEVEGGFALQLGPRPLNPRWLEPHEMEHEARERIATDRERRRRVRETILAQTPDAERQKEEARLDRQEGAIRGVENERLEAEVERLYQVRKAREQNWPRERVLIVGALLLSGASPQAVALEGFIAQQRELVGQRVSLTPRIGLESEPIPNVLHGRVGSYLEPSRFENGSIRQHFTFGADLRLFDIAPFHIFEQTLRLTLSADLAPRYQNFGLGLGAWH